MAKVEQKVSFQTAPQSLSPIPIQDWAWTSADYRQVPFDRASSYFTEPLVRIKDYGIAGDSFYGRTDGGNWPYNKRITGSLKDVWCRQTIVSKLKEVNDFLRPHDLEVFVYDGYRSISCQQGLWDFFSVQSMRLFPNASEEVRRDYVLTYVSDPTRFKREDSATWPLHSTGGAVDLTLRSTKNGEILDMGARFDEGDVISASDYVEKLCLVTPSSQNIEIRNNRRLLYNAMIKVGFRNYPHEFWHYDWGNQAYAFNKFKTDYPRPTCLSYAWYGYIDTPESNT